GKVAFVPLFGDKRRKGPSRCRKILYSEQFSSFPCKGRWAFVPFRPAPLARGRSTFPKGEGVLLLRSKLHSCRTLNSFPLREGGFCPLFRGQKTEGSFSLC